MKDGLRFVDCDMHVMEPSDLFDKYLDPKLKHRVLTPVGADGKTSRGMRIVIDGFPRTVDEDTQQYRKPTRSVTADSNQPLSSSRMYNGLRV